MKKRVGRLDEAGSLFKGSQLPLSVQSRPSKRLSVVGLFAGIGGIERGLEQTGHRGKLLCEIDPGAQAVLRQHFPYVHLEGDIRCLRSLPEADLIAAGFPCQDLSQAGQTAGIEGKQSGLVGEVFRLLAHMRKPPRWLLLENVPFMLQLQRGRAMAMLTESLEALGYSWAYRTVDTRAFGLPQRRQRVLLLASTTEDPREILYPDDAGEPVPPSPEGRACGFYWTEGYTGLGWAVDAVPTLKGGSTIGIPSPPAIWMRYQGGAVVVPDVRDAERLQGFPVDWTLPAMAGRKVRQGARWKLVGNAVSVPVAEWIGRCLANPRGYDEMGDVRLRPGEPWPAAAWGREGKHFRANISAWPVHAPYQHLAEFLQFPTVPLSARGAAGFLARARRSSLHFVDGFLDAVAAHLETVQGAASAVRIRS